MIGLSRKHLTIGAVEILDFVIIQIHASHRPSLVKTILEPQGLKLIDPNAIVIGPRRKRRRVDATDLDSIAGELLGEAEASWAGADDHRVEVAAIGIRTKQREIELQRLGLGLGFEVKKVAEFADAMDLEVLFERRVKWGRGEFQSVRKRER